MTPTIKEITSLVEDIKEKVQDWDCELYFCICLPGHTVLRMQGTKATALKLIKYLVDDLIDEKF